MSERRRLVVLLVAVVVIVVCGGGVGVWVVRAGRMSSAASSTTESPAIAEPVAMPTAPVHSTPLATMMPPRAPPPAWVATLVKLPSNPDAIKPKSVEEGTGRGPGPHAITSLNKYEYALPPLAHVTLEFNPDDLRQYTLTFDVAKSVDLESALTLEKLCDEGDSPTFKVGAGPLKGACVTLDLGEKADTTTEVSIESTENLRRVQTEMPMFRVSSDAGVDRCGCP